MSVGGTAQNGAEQGQGILPTAITHFNAVSNTQVRYPAHRFTFKCLPCYYVCRHAAGKVSSVAVCAR